METVTIQSVIAKKTGAKNGKPWTISEVTLADGRKVDTFDSFTQGETVSVEIIPNQKDPQYNANMRRAKSGGQQQAASFKNAEVANKAIEANKDKERRITMLSCISSACTFYAQRSTNIAGGTLKDTDITDLAKQFFHLAFEDGTDKLPF